MISVYNYSVTGDCSNTGQGAVYFDITGSSPFAVTCLVPGCGLPTSAGTTNYSVTGLSAGTYFMVIVDAISTTAYTTVYISSGTCVSISDESDTTCGLNDGSLTATTPAYYGLATFELYDQSTNTLITSAQTPQNSIVFNSLSAGTYYVIADDGGGCTGKSESCIIKSSTTFNFGLYIINDSPCIASTGSIYVTGQTGTPPFTYSWTNGSTNSFITGLTSGDSYTVTVTDSLGCSNSIATVMGSTPALSIVSLIATSPTCFNSDGTATVTVFGGTPPYYFSGSNGDIIITFSNTYTFTSLPAGLFSVFAQDAGFCQAIDSVSLLTPGGLAITSITPINSYCNNLSGQIDISVYGGSPPYTYVLTDSMSVSTSATTSFSFYTFGGLSSGTYTLTISDLGPCTYTDTIVINNVEKYTLSASTTGTTCGLDNGVIELTISTGGTSPYTYEFQGQFLTTTALTCTFSGLTSGNYTAKVTDSDSPPCYQSLTVSIPTSTGVDFILIGTDALGGSDGSVQAFITQGNPLFSLSWSPNVNGQTGTTITNLTAGTYTLTVTDSDGCVMTRSVKINGYNNLSSYQLFEVCDNEFVHAGLYAARGPRQYLIEGFHDLTDGFTNCILNQAIFQMITDVDGVVKTQDFYTGYTLNDYPTDGIYNQTIEDLLLSYPNIGEVLVNIVNNEISVGTDCNAADLVSGVEVAVYLRIRYDISCVACEDYKQFQDYEFFEFMDYEIYDFQN